MTIFLRNPIHFQDVSNRLNGLVAIWDYFLSTDNHYLNDFANSCIDILRHLSTDELFSLLKNLLSTKLFKVKKLLGKWKSEGNAAFRGQATNLLAKNTCKNPLIIGFVVFRYICILLRHELSSDHILIIEEFKKLLRESVFDDDLLMYLMNLQEQAQEEFMRCTCHACSQRCLLKIGWFNLANRYMNACDFDHKPFHVAG
jgi:hypothetical protein